MPRSSKALLSDETIQELENQFYNFIDSINSSERKKFFSEFLTNEEKMMMYKRLALYWCLLEGYSLAKIQQMIGVTHDTTRVYNKKKNTLSSEFKELVQRIAKSDAIDAIPVKETVIEEKFEAQEASAPHEAVTEETVEEVIEIKSEEPEVVEVNASETDDDKNEEELKMDAIPEEKVEEKSEDKSMDDSSNNIWTVEHNEEEKEEEMKKEDSSETHIESQSSESSEESTEKKEEDESGEKKSKFAKFFGF